MAAPVSLQAFRPLLHGRAPVSDGLGSSLITSICVELHHRGHEIEVFTLSQDPCGHGEFRGERLTVFVGPYRQRFRWGDAFAVERRYLTDAIRSGRCDIVHAHWSYEFALAALRSGKPTLVTLHDWAPKVLRYQKHPYRVVRLGMQWVTLRRAQHITANSPYISERASRWAGREIPVVPNGIEFPSSFPDRSARPATVLGALNAGFGPLKNVGALMEAFANVRAALPNTSLRLAGPDFGVGGVAHEWAMQRGITDGVEFLGGIAARDVPAFMRSLDLFVHPSLEESFGMVLLEALMEGTPVVAGRDSGAVPWVLDHGAAGSLVDVRSSESIARELIKLLEDPSALRNMAGVGFESVKDRFSLERVVDLYEREYRKVLGDVRR